MTRRTGVLHARGLEAFAVALALFDGASLTPALRAVWRSPAATGVSVTSWVLRAGVATGWLIYAIGVGHPAAGGWAVVLVPAAGPVVR